MSPSLPQNPAPRVPAPDSRRVFLLFAFLVLAVKWPVLEQPPVWDASMSVFPAAITLAATDFDLAGLLQQPGYLYGGPNVHALSVVTWLTALVYLLLGPHPELVLPLLHLLHFAVGVTALTVLWRIGAQVMGAWPSLAAVGVVFLLPLVQVQLGTIYLDVPVLATTTLAVDAWIRGSTRRAAAWGTLAALIKPTGTIAAGALALASLLSGGPLVRRLREAVTVTSGPLVVATLSFLLRPGDALGFGRLRTTLIYLAAIPDLAIVLALFTVLCLVDRPWRRAAAPTGATSTGDVSRRAHLAFAALLFTFFAFFALLAGLGTSVPILPRYYLQLVPFAFLGTAAILNRRLPARLGLALLALVAVISVVNRRGRLYPFQGMNNFAVAERSMAYADLLALQRQGLERLVDRSQREPVFYSLPDHYRLAYPAMGYGIASPADGHCILNETPYHAGRLQDFPPTFSLLFEFPWLGGEVVQRVVLQAGADPTRRVERTTLRSGSFTSELFRISPAVAALPGGPSPRNGAPAVAGRDPR